jgi:hypothetical protein
MQLPMRLTVPLLLGPRRLRQPRTRAEVAGAAGDPLRVQPPIRLPASPLSGRRLRLRMRKLAAAVAAAEADLHLWLPGRAQPAYTGNQRPAPFKAPAPCQGVVATPTALQHSFWTRQRGQAWHRHRRTECRRTVSTILCSRCRSDGLMMQCALRSRAALEFLQQAVIP